VRGEAFPRVAPFALFIALMAIGPWTEDLVEPFLDPRWLYGIRSAITLLLVLALWSRLPELGGRGRSGGGAWLAAVGVGILVFVLWILMDGPPFVIGEASGFDPRNADGRVHLGIAASRIAGSALLVPVIEEVFWRSFLQRWLHHPRFTEVDPRATGWKPLVISSAVFATEHRLIVAGFLAGLAYGELYRRTGDLRLAVLAHAVTNGLLGWWVLTTGTWTLW